MILSARAPLSRLARCLAGMTMESLWAIVVLLMRLSPFLGVRGGEAGGTVTKGDNVEQNYLFQSKHPFVVVPDEAERRSGTGEPRRLF